MGKDTLVYLGSAELGAVCAKLGRIPTPLEYKTMATSRLEGKSGDLYNYLNFHQIEGFKLN